MTKIIKRLEDIETNGTTVLFSKFGEIVIVPAGYSQTSEFNNKFAYGLGASMTKTIGTRQDLYKENRLIHMSFNSQRSIIIDKICLKHHKNNEYDKFAIRIEIKIEDKYIDAGYIPASFSEIFFRELNRIEKVEFLNEPIISTDKSLIVYPIKINYFCQEKSSLGYRLTKCIIE